MGVSHGIFNVNFRSSILRRQLALTTSNRECGQNLKATLLEWEWPNSSSRITDTETDEQLSPIPPEWIILTG